MLPLYDTIPRHRSSVPLHERDSHWKGSDIRSGEQLIVRHGGT